MGVKKKCEVRRQETEDRRQNEKHWNSGRIEMGRIRETESRAME
jgi:hypothetical protein